MAEQFHYKGGLINGKVKVPGDKSISHRAVMLASIADGETVIDRFLHSEDCRRTIEAFKSLGVHISENGEQVKVLGKGVNSLRQPNTTLDMGNSGTTTRLLIGLLSALPFNTHLNGDESLINRPMGRVLNPLTEMGAQFFPMKDENKLPLQVKGGQLQPITYRLPVDSAQVKSSILLAGLLTNGTTTVIENNPTRDHTEKMLSAFGGSVEVDGQHIKVSGKQSLKSTNITVPGDQSSAAFWIAVAVITPGSHLILEEVGVNSTRMGLVNVLKRMGANINVSVERYIGDEPVGTIEVAYSELIPTTITEQEIPSMVDEIPLLALIATQTKGEMKINHIKELRYKETDRIEATVSILQNLGATVFSSEDQIVVKGPTQLKGGSVQSENDHRMAMMAVIASIISDEPVTIDETDCINVSYPTFFEDMRLIMKEIEL
ncbi:3-phosphoshikimate 1-carboxyvinyltransferase [Alkalibacillus haloalkaliphilus]|uniref:3-phosphoshikimate 1-carboxyvinyltransferase n=1 Tax=Alkalibacillus haloalkaliphilus TaxID=94136 RepID=A0A511W720_9BACI|nr:3-phosphoshikimate 1-carboxyvinyltransferase [Alkalibacillus haloalkaliphilus]GEN45152.1 3-phosphoshikimate 1-carboxyvinyltransferase [Alkalibacillus haloalkaliphilus]